VYWHCSGCWTDRSVRSPRRPAGPRSLSTPPAGHAGDDPRSRAARPDRSAGDGAGARRTRPRSTTARSLGLAPHGAVARRRDPLGEHPAVLIDPAYHQVGRWLRAMALDDGSGVERRQPGLAKPGRSRRPVPTRGGGAEVVENPRLPQAGSPATGSAGGGAVGAEQRDQTVAQQAPCYRVESITLVWARPSPSRRHGGAGPRTRRR
jgi:hypothetical protein